ncbi:general secretion pathway protein GspB [Hydrogenophaga pseudoflava]|uniref:general secretion pathway protein GspB n=1 Tax=Hydrogenophaga pseudoflava TaxID=47421 RepID=UPI0027E518A8|nr:general secretion pathway protein GspB [Hydrogenophaga pseudoflava]MDQ7746461.1 general secretion pathway protein GspB [Hydrogenophaga pseudoflava]
MSYILDALKRADAERERGHVPGLHSQGTPAPAARTARSRQPGLPWVAGGIALLLAAAAVFWWWRAASGGPQPPAATVQAPGHAPVTAEVNAAAPPTAPAPALPILAPAPPPPPAAAPPATAPRPPAAGPASNAASPDGQPPPAGAAPASAPPVQISGVTYSSNASHRMLIANGKVVREGEEIEPGLKVEVISPRSAILNHRGSRYNINY